MKKKMNPSKVEKPDVMLHIVLQLQVLFNNLTKQLIQIRLEKSAAPERYTLEDVDRAVSHWAQFPVGTKYIKEFLDRE